MNETGNSPNWVLTYKGWTRTSEKNNNEKNLLDKYDFANQKIRKIVEILNDEQEYHSLLTSNSSTSDNSIYWDNHKTKQLFHLISLVGTHWPVIHNNIEFFEPSKPEIITVDEDSINLKIYIDLNVENQIIYYSVTELKDRFYHVLRCILKDDTKYKYSGISDKTRRQTLESTYDINNDDRIEKIRIILDNLKQIATQPAIDKEIIEAKIKKSIGSLIPSNVAIGEYDTTLFCNYTPFSDIFDTLLTSDSVILVSQLTLNATEMIATYLRNHNKNNVLLNPSKDYFENVEQILQEASHSVTIDLMEMTSSDGKPYDLNRYIRKKNLPDIYSLETYNSYVSSIYNIYLITIYQKQLKHMESLISSWSNKLIDLRKTTRTTKKSMKISQKML